MKKNIRLPYIAITALACLGASSVFNGLMESNTVSLAELAPNRVKEANKIYKFPTDWVTRMMTGLLTTNTYTSCGYYFSVNSAKEIAFYDTLDETYAGIMKGESYVTSFVFEKVAAYYSDICVMVNVRNLTSGTLYYPTKIAFYSVVGYTIQAQNYAYFSGLNATKYVFNNFEFSSYDQYETVMTGTNKDATVSGTDVPKKSYTSITQWKDALDDATSSTDFYKTVTDIKFTSSSSDLSGYTDTGITIGTTKIYRKGTSVIFYDTSKTSAPESVASLFNGCTALKTLDMTNLDLSSSTTYTSFLTGCSALSSIVMPSTVGGEFDLPSTFYDNTIKDDYVKGSNSNAGHTLTIHKTHTLTKHDAKASTCNEQGWSEYYTCDICGTYFTDSEGKNATSGVPYTAKLDHVLVYEIVLAEDRKSAQVQLTCKNDNKDLGTVNADSITLSKKVDPTCDEDGYSEYEVTFTYEGKTYIDTVKAKDEDKLGHKYEYAVELSSDKTSATITVTCENEGDTVKDTITSDDVTKTEKKATHYEDGEVTYTVSFTYDGSEHTEEIKETIPKLTDKLTYECILDEADKTKGQIKITHEDGEVEYVDAVVTSKEILAPTCHSEGETEYTFTATHEGHEITEIMAEATDMLPHDYDYDISIDDINTATVKKNCKNEDGKTIETVKASITAKEEGGETTYSITVDGKEIDVTDKVNEYLEGLDNAAKVAKYKEILDNLDKDTVKTSDSEDLALAKEYLEDTKDYDKTSYDTYIEKYNELKAVVDNVSSSIKAIDSAIDTDLASVTKENVTSASASIISDTKDKIETLLEKPGNLTDSEKTKLNEQLNYLNGLETKLDNDAAIKNLEDKFIRDDKTSITKENVTEDDKTVLESIISEGEKLLEDTSLTDGQKTQIQGDIDKAHEILASLLYNEVKAYFDSKSTSNITTSDETQLESYKEKADSLLDTEGEYYEYLDSEQISNLNSFVTGEDSKYNDLKEEIENIKTSISDFEDAVEDFEASYTTDDASDIQTLIDSITEFKDTTYNGRLSETEDNTLDDLLSRLNALKEDIQDIQDKIDAADTIYTEKGYTEDTVKTSDKEDITSLKTTYENILTEDGTHLSEAEKTAIQEKIDALDALLNKIDEVEDTIDSIADAIEGKTVDNVKSSDKENLEAALEKANELLSSDNLTAEEIKEVTGYKETIEALLDKITEVSDDIDSIADAIDGKTVDNVKTSDKASLEAALEKANDLLSNDNLTADEITEVTEYKNTIEALLDKIADIETDIDFVDAALKDKTVDNVTSDDKTNLDLAKDTVNELLEGDNLTTKERASLTEKAKEIDALLNKIDEVEKEIADIKTDANKYTTDSVKSSDSAALDKIIEDIDSLLETDNLTEEQTSELTALKDTINSYKDKISETKDTIDSINEALNGKTTDNVKTSDKEALEEAKENIDSLLSGDNITSSERSDLEGQKKTIESLLNKIGEVETAIDEATKALDGKTVDNVTKDDKEALEGVEEAVDKVLTDYDNNLTTEEKADLASKKEEAKNLLDKIKEVEEKIDSIDDKIGTKTVDNIKTSDKDSLNDAKDLVDDLLSDSENLTADERKDLEDKKEEIQDLLDKIDEIEGDISSIDASIDGKTEDNVKTDDKSSLEEAKNTIDSLLEGDNITTEEKNSLTEKEETIDSLLDKIDDIEKALAEIDSLLDGKTTANIKSDDKADVKEAQDKIDEVLKDYADNLTAAQKAELSSKDDLASSLLDKIDEVKNDIASIDAAIDGKTTSNVTSNDKAALESAKEKIDDLLDSDNLTSEERTALLNKKNTIASLLNKIQEVKDSIDEVADTIGTKTELNVTSDDKSSLESVEDEIDSLLNGTNLTAEERKTLTDEKAAVETMLDKIDDIQNSLSSIDNAINGKTTSNVTSDDEASLIQAKEEIEELLEGNNLTSEQRQDLTNKKSTIDSLLNKIKEVEDAIDAIDDALDGKTTSNVTSNDKAALEDAQKSIDSLLNGTNLTKEERAELEKDKADIQALLNKIKEVQDAIKKIDDSLSGKTTDNVTSDDKTALEETKNEIDSLLNGSNLTAEEKKALEEDKTDAESLINKINSVKEEVDVVTKKLEEITKSGVTEENKEEFEEAIEKAEDLAESGNLTEEEKRSLKGVITSAKDALSKAKSKTNIWWIIITLGTIAIIEALIVAGKKKKKNKKKATKTNAVALPVLALFAISAIPAGQIVIASILACIVLVLTIYTIYVCSKKKDEDDND